MKYNEAVEYINSFINYEAVPSYNYENSFNLGKMTSLLRVLKNPHKGIKYIHITGTKGKGSTAAITSSILTSARMKTGLYTSPHLVSFRERIRIDGEEIGEDEVAGLTDEIKSAVDKSGHEKFSFFELCTALAFLYFRMKKVDIAVLEVGMGGRLDATNVVEPLVACITPISLEHTMQLGPTIKDISKEKAAIIKEGCVCITAPQPDEAEEVISLECKKRNVRLYKVGRDIFYEGGKELSPFGFGETFSVFGMFGEYPCLWMRLLGEHQIINAATAIGIIEALRFHNIVIPSEAVREGLSRVSWPGRLEVIEKRPLVVLDGAQNRASAVALKEAVKRSFCFNRLILVLGVCKDKDIKGICGELEGISDEIILTKAGTPRAEAPAVLGRYIKGKKTYITGDVSEAIRLSKRIAGGGDLILITGSFFVVGEAKQILKNGKD